MRNRLLGVVSIALLPSLGLSFQYFGSQNQGLTVQPAPDGVLSVPSSASLTSTGTLFQPFTGNLLINYEVRTTPSGSASLTIQAASDFSPANGPSVAAGNLMYTCGAASLGTACVGTTTVSTSSQTAVVNVGGGACTGGGGACSSTSPNTVQMNFVLTDNPSFRTGTYTANLTLSISAL